MNIWIVNEGSPGHISQSRGIATEIAEKLNSGLYEVNARMTLPGILRPLIRFMGNLGYLPWPVVKASCNIGLPKGTPNPDIIISSGGKSVVPGRYFAEKYKAHYIYIGERKHYPASWFHTVLTPVQSERSHNSIILDVIPSMVSPDTAKKAADKYELPDGRYWTLIIGGRSRSHCFEDEDWLNIAEGANRLAQKNNIKWLVTTSRRTGEKAEKILRSNINTQHIQKAVWWSENPEKCVQAFLGKAEFAFVTQDSVTMITEAVSSGTPTVAIRPLRTAFDSRSFLVEYYHNLDEKKLIIPKNCSDFGGYNCDIGDFEICNPKVIQEKISKAVLKRISAV
ncbi:mitochondrial fission ELM1 family protein [Sedimentisphaera salicampi]|uniref:Nucleoside-diphosphate sugar epimerase n=1 Tax=Sedimentisphaera salicampi TaxID=1941349 RepID=A0A1W6LM44_9BACT|nr:ELM1/GtrOC1 family putative glycosyltransferase [Sedimentisphaera salicampi]ARN56837.1 hypothetical protein STSP1_01229 [Sedimentisphaera salicampi]